MKHGKIILSVLLTTAMCLALCIGMNMSDAHAASGSSLSNNDMSAEQAAEMAVQEEIARRNEENIKNSTITTATGQTVKSQLIGSYAVKSMQGFAVTTPLATVATDAGLDKNETPCIGAYDISATTSPNAFASLNGAAESVGGKVLSAVNVALGKVGGENGEEVAGLRWLPADVTVSTTAGIPLDKYEVGKTYAVVKVAYGGETTIYEDTDSDPYTVTFPVSGGLAAYAIISY